MLASHRAALGSQHPSTFVCVYNLAGLLEQLGQLREAETLLNEAMSGRWRVLGPAHHQTQSALNLLVRVLMAQGKARAARDVKAQYRCGR